MLRLAANHLFNKISQNVPDNLNKRFRISGHLQHFFVTHHVTKAACHHRDYNFTLLNSRHSFLLHPSLVFSCLWPSDTDYLRYLFPQFVKSNLYHLCYTSIGQRISICNYWNGETNGVRVCQTVRLCCSQCSHVPLLLLFRPPPQRPVREQQRLLGSS